jgi:cytochrome c oxidase cbb3-type subunit 4
MDVNDLRIVLTVLSFVVFIGIVIWAYSGRRKGQFEEAARLAVDDEPVVTVKSSGQGRLA